MFRIDTTDAVNNKFVDGNPQIGQPGTMVTAEWLNDVQESLAQAVLYGGLALSKGDGTQLWKAIVAIAQGVGGGGGSGVGSVPTTRQIATQGLITGGHGLDSDVTLNVPIAAGADIVAGTSNAKAITPSGLASLFGIAADANEVTLTLPGGFMLKMGTNTTPITGQGAINVPFATAFPTKCLFAFAMPLNTTASSIRDSALQIVSKSQNGVQFYQQGMNTTNDMSMDGMDYLAFGH